MTIKLSRPLFRVERLLLIAVFCCGAAAHAQQPPAAAPAPASAEAPANPAATDTQPDVPALSINRSADAIRVMVGLAQEASTVLSFSQLYAACTESAPPPELQAEPESRAMAFRAVTGFMVSLGASVPQTIDDWYRGCATRMVQATGPRGRVYSHAEFEQAVKSGDVAALPRPVAPPDDLLVVAPATTHLYIRLRHFDKELPAELLAALRAVPLAASTPKVLDLRGNSGGLLEVSHWLASVLGRNEDLKPWAAVRYRPEFGPTRAFAWQQVLRLRVLYPAGVQIPTDEELARWNGGNWIVLIDRDTSNNAAWLAAVLQELNGALLVGGTADSDTAGTDILRQLPRGDVIFGVRYQTGLLALPSGRPLTPGYVVPDVPVALTAPLKAYPKTALDWPADPLYTGTVAGLLAAPLAQSSRRVRQ